MLPLKSSETYIFLIILGGIEINLISLVNLNSFKIRNKIWKQSLSYFEVALVKFLGSSLSD